MVTLQDMLGTLGQLSEVVQQCYSAVVPTSFVWGYGRPLWDPSSRKHGLKPLKILLLGPAASGKSTQCALLAARWVQAACRGAAVQPTLQAADPRLKQACNSCTYNLLCKNGLIRLHFSNMLCIASMFTQLPMYPNFVILALRARFNIPHINAGDLLYAEVASKTPLGLEAKQYMDSSKTVPDHLLLTLLLRRLAAPDCQAQGWALDGFPHTRKQV
jgi:hypothetical protein